ncbi:MAG: molybdopterin-binding protein [Anaerolineae bacterium]
MTNVEIVAVGNELLLGDVLDTNTNWLCKRITGLGGRVRRAVMVEDDVEVIATEIGGALARGEDVVITTGGLGPTADDMTLSAVAQALDVPLELSAEALALVRAKYVELAKQGYVESTELSQERRKMAVLPRGAQPLYNPVGTAPGVVLKVGDSTIISLPGVPEELKGIFTASLQPFLKELLGESVFIEKIVTVRCGDESILAPIVNKVAEEHSDVYVKSMAPPFRPEKKIPIILSLAGSDQGQVEAAIEKALGELKRGLADAGISIISIR